MMKKTTLLLLLLSVFMMPIAKAQFSTNVPTSQDEVEALFDKYYKDNQASVTITFTVLEQKDMAHFSKKEKQQVINSRKRLQLRAQFFNLYPQYRVYYQPSLTSLNDCFNAGFEGPPNQYGFSSHDYMGQNIPDVFNDCQMTINTLIPEAPGPIDDYSSQVSIVTAGNDPTLLPFSINLPKVNNGARAIRLNADQPGADIVTMSQLVNITDDLFVFNFASVLENPTSGIHLDNQPFFQVRILNNFGDVVVERCIISNADDCIFQVANPTTTSNLLYSEWSCFVIDTQALIGQTVTVEYSVADCGLSGHFGYVYIDDTCQSECADGSFGYINLDEIDGDCPNFPIEVCGTFDASLNAVLSDITLNVYDIPGNFVAQVSTTPQVNGNNFCFTVQEADLPVPLTPYEFNVVVNFEANCDTLPFTITREDTSTNVGPDLSYEDCCTGGDAFPLNFGYEDRWLRRVSNVVVSTSGDTFVYLDAIGVQSPELTALENTDFTDGSFILKFDENECLLDYFEIPNTPNFASYYGDLQIDNQDNIYLTSMQDNRFIKLNENLDLQFNHELSIRFRGNLNINDNQAASPTGTSYLVYGDGTSQARFNGNFIVTPQPAQIQGPILTLVNTTTGVPMNPYVFDIPQSLSTSLGPVIGDAIEVVGNQVYFAHYLYSGIGPSIDFNGTTYTIPASANSFVSKFNIVGNTLQPDILVFSDQWYFNLEYNEQDNYLYAGNNNQIDVFDDNLNMLVMTATLGGTTLNDMFFDYESETLLVTTFAEAGAEEHLRMFDETLGTPVWELSETLTGPFAGIYVPEVTRRGDDIYLVGIYKSTTGLNNGLPASMDFDFYMERIDASTLPSPSPFVGLTKSHEVATPSFSLYPNPTTNAVFIHSVQNEKSIVDITILDFSGTEVFTQNEISVLEDVRLDVNHLKAGMYFVQIAKSNGAIEMHRLVIRK
jgi:hypothetical protein